MIIHQTLHGYNQGHTLLASSLTLPSIDDDLMKVMSDWTEYSGDANGDSSYIMGYPLPDGKYYAIAKSWYANEMPRPGCVWTHTLLVDLENLENDFDFRQLLHLFQRPDNESHYTYDRTLEISGNQSHVDTVFLAINQISQIQIMYILVQLLQSSRRFAIERSSDFYQNLCLCLIQYLPSGVLARVAFFTGSASGRYFQNVESSLQFTNHNSVPLLTMESTGGLEVSNFNKGIRSLGNAILNNDEGLPKFLRIFSSDIGSSVLKLCTVAYLSECLDMAIDASSSALHYNDILLIISESFPSGEGSNIKKAFLSERVSNVFDSEENILIEIATFKASQTLDYSLDEYEHRVIRHANQDKESYIHLLSNLLKKDYFNQYGKRLLDNSYKFLQLDDLVMISSQDWPTYISLVTLCPQLLSVSIWVDFPEDRFLPAYEIFQKNCNINFDKWDVLFLVVLYKHYHINETMNDRFISYVPNLVYLVMEYLNGSIQYILDNKLRDYCLAHIDQISNWMNGRDSLNRVVVEFILTNVIPNSIDVRQSSSSAWKAYANSSFDDTDKYYTFLFLLSYNWSDANALAYLKKAFYPIHQLVANSALSWSSWEKIRPYTGSVLPWQEWDKCKKLRKGVVERLKALKVSKTYVESFTPDLQLNKALLKLL